MIRLIVASSAFLIVEAAIAQDASKLVGGWKLLSYEVEFQDGSPARPMFGHAPIGYLFFTPGGRMAAILEAEGRSGNATRTDAS